MFDNIKLFVNLLLCKYDFQTYNYPVRLTYNKSVPLLSNFVSNLLQPTMNYITHNYIKLNQYMGPIII